jgi:hypothetical protein
MMLEGVRLVGGAAEGGGVELGVGAMVDWAATLPPRRAAVSRTRMIFSIMAAILA